MTNWRKILTRLADKIDDRFDELSLALRQRLDQDRPVNILPYLGYGTQESLFLRGRVLEHSGARAAQDKDRIWDNLLNTYRHLESDEVPQAVIRATHGMHAVTATTNEEGYFEIKIPADIDPEENHLWYPIELELLEAPIEFDGPVTAIGRVLVPPTGSRFGIISDIDDTVLQSSATNYLKAARLMFLQNARTRMPFAGVAALYQMLQQGDGTQEARNPVFYVSSSPWNLYNLLTDFLEFQNIPTGPLFLKDYGFTDTQLFTSGHGAHKMAQIDKLLTTYPDLPFILIGDSGQEDPEIYYDVVKQYPERILAVYIRDVTSDARDREVQAIAAETEALGVRMLLTKDSLVAAEHAATLGLLDPEKLPRIHAVMQADQQAPDEVDRLLEA